MVVTEYAGGAYRSELLCTSSWGAEELLVSDRCQYVCFTIRRISFTFVTTVPFVYQAYTWRRHTVWVDLYSWYSNLRSMVEGSGDLVIDNNTNINRPKLHLYHVHAIYGRSKDWGPVPRASPRMVMLERPVRLNIKAQQDDAYCVPDIVESSSSIAIHPATLIVYHKLFPVFDC